MTSKIFKDFCNLRFGLPPRANPLGELVNLKQTGTVEEYQRQFQKLLVRASSVGVDQQVDLFTTDLSDPIRWDVEIHNPPNLAIAMSLARGYERKQQLTRQRSFKKGSAFNSRTPTSDASVTARSSATKGPLPSSGCVTTPFSKRLS